MDGLTCRNCGNTGRGLTGAPCPCGRRYTQPPLIEPKPEGRALVVLRYRDVEQLLNLPRDIRVAGIYEAPEYAGLLVQVASERLPEGKPGDMLPRLWAEMECQRDALGNETWSVGVQLPTKE